jgi:hypothetical protein
LGVPVGVSPIEGGPAVSSRPRDQRAARCTIGSVTVNVEPSPTVLSHAIRPPCSSTILRVM